MPERSDNRTPPVGMQTVLQPNPVRHGVPHEVWPDDQHVCPLGKKRKTRISSSHSVLFRTTKVLLDDVYVLNLSQEEYDEGWDDGRGPVRLDLDQFGKFDAEGPEE